MALPEPVLNVPRIYEVLDPGYKKYSVMVRMPTHLAAKFPNKLWDIGIDEIGLAPKDTERFPGYVLVGFQAMKGESDLLWVFEDLNGPIWDTVTRSRENLIPQKFREDVLTVKTEQDVLPGTPPDVLAGDKTLSSVERQKNMGKSVKTDITETIGEDSTPILGRVAYVERNTAGTSEQLVNEGTMEDTGLYIVDSRVSPLGNGKSIKETTKADAPWPIHTGSRWDDQLGTSVLFTEEFISPGTWLGVPYTDVSIVNKDRNLRHTETVPTDALGAYHSIIPTQINLGDLPRELISVSIIWNYNYSIGTQDYAFQERVSGNSFSIGGDASDRASSSASLNGDVQFKFRDYASSNLPGTKHEFYVREPVTEAKILARLGAQRWPVFKPQTETVSVLGQGIQVSVNASASLTGSMADGEIVRQGWSRGASDDVSINLSNSTVSTPPCIHGPIQFSGKTVYDIPIVASALISLNNSLVGSITSTKTKAGKAMGRVYPTEFMGVTGPMSIPTSGIYVMDVDIYPAKWGWCRVVAIVFDAKNLA